MNNWKRRLIILCLFTALTLLMTYPQIFHLGRGLRDLGDPLLNTWILSWNIHKITNLDFHRYFDTNMFYPNTRTLAYSEHLLPQALVALPVWLVSKNPILSYNVVFLLAILTSGLGMFSLARHLVQNDFAATVAGLIFAFSPFMFAHLSHLQVLTAAGIPMAFLFLHKFFETRRTQDILLFALFYVLQFLANGYYGLYLTLFASLFLLAMALSRKAYKDTRFWAQIGLFLLLVLAGVGPFLYQYFRLRNEMGFIREMGLSASLKSFLSTAPLNRLYGKITAPFLKPEAELFPGLLAFALALLGFLWLVRKKRTEETLQAKNVCRKKIVLASYRAVNVLILIALVLSAIILVTGGWEFSVVGKLRLRAHGLHNPILVLVFLFVIRWLMNRKYSLKKRRISFQENPILWIYGNIFLLAFLFTFGPQGPYLFLYKYVPGFDGLRVPARFHIFVMFTLSVFAAFGVKKLLLGGRSWKTSLGKALIVLLILVEYASMPLPVKSIPVKKEIPEVYQWLLTKKEDLVLLELPLPNFEKGRALVECLRLYYSIYHWKKMVNGYSGYFPPLFDEICRRWKDLRFDQNIADLQTLGVNIIIIHASDLTKKDIKQIISEWEILGDEVQTTGIFGTDYVLTIKSPKIPRVGSVLPPQARPLPKDGWRVESNVNQKIAALAIDGSLATRWESGPQKSGVYFMVDLQKLQPVRGISLKLGRSYLDYPRGYVAEISGDGVHWERVARQEKTIIPIQAFLNPKDLSLDIPLGPKEARFIRITNTGEDPVFYWSICEIEVYQ
jgi:hypothetical protein